MIAREQNIALKLVGKAALDNPLWKDYAGYCFAREAGQRKQAFECLNRFLASMEQQASGEKQAFASFLFPFFETVEAADHGPFPQPLAEQLLRPVLIEWCNQPTADSRPFRWYGAYFNDEDSLLKALQIDSRDDLARQQLIRRQADSLYFSLHHLPDSYIGDLDQDADLVARLEDNLEALSCPTAKQSWKQKLAPDLEIFHNYQLWHRSGHANLEQWGIENNKPVGYSTGAAYYYSKD